jgi:hypothetical protein
VKITIFLEKTGKIVFLLLDRLKSKVFAFFFAIIVVSDVVNTYSIRFYCVSRRLQQRHPMPKPWPFVLYQVTFVRYRRSKFTPVVFVVILLKAHKIPSANFVRNNMLEE